MRVVAIALVLFVTLLQLLLGVTHILGASYRGLSQGAAAEDAASLVGGRLDRAPPPPPPRNLGEAKGTQLLLGVLCLALVVVGLAAMVVLARRLRRRLAATLLAAGGLGSLVHLIAAQDGATLTLIAAIGFALALGAGLLMRWQPAAAETA